LKTSVCFSFQNGVVNKGLTRFIMASNVRQTVLFDKVGWDSSSIYVRISISYLLMPWRLMPPGHQQVLSSQSEQFTIISLIN